MASSLKDIKAHQVQTSSDFSTWTTQATIRCTECSEGAGQIVGTASMLRYIGNVREPGVHTAPASQVPLTGLVGQWVRVLIEEVGGSVNIGGIDYAPLWYGIIDAERIIDMAGGIGTQSWTCAGLAAHLTRVTLADGWTEAIDSSGATASDFILRIPEFNSPEGGGASTPSYTIDGVSCKLFDAYGGVKWTANQILTMLLAAHGRWNDPATGSFVGGLSFVLSAGTLLDWEAPTIDVHGMTLLDAIQAIISPRRGLSWRLTVSGAVATINVKSIAVSAITVPATTGAGSYAAFTLPAATDTTSPTLTDRFIQDVELLEDQTATFDAINVVGRRPWVTISLAYDPANATPEARSLTQAWQSSEETTWNTAPDSTTDGVWRTFRLGGVWDGRQYNDSTVGVRQSLLLSGSDFTGERTYDSAIDFPPSVMRLEPKLPCGQGFTSTKTGPRQDCLAFWKPNGSSTWYDLQADGAIWTRNVTIEDYPCAVHLGTADRSVDKSQSQQQVNKFNLTTGGILVVTVGIREPDPLIVSYTRASGSRPRTNPRTLTVHMPDAEQWVITKNTVKSVSAGALVTAGAQVIVRDDVQVMRGWLAFLRAYYAEPARQIQWTNIGTIEHAYGSGAPAPAALVTTATLGIGSRTINAVVTRRTWRLTDDGFGTSYSTERIVPDIESIR